MTTLPRSVRITIGFILANALVWLAFAVIVAARLHPALPAGGSVRAIYIVLALLTTMALVVLAILLTRRNRGAYYLTVASLVVLSLLTIADQVGVADVAVLILMLIPLTLLVRDRAWYLRQDATTTRAASTM